MSSIRNITFDDELYKEVKVAAIRSDLTVSEWLDQVCRKALGNTEAPEKPLRHRAKGEG